MSGEPTIEQGHIDAALTDFAVQRLFFVKEYVSNLIAPPQGVSKQSGKYFIIDPREMGTDEHEEELMYGQVATELNFVVGEGSYATQLMAKRHLLPDGIERNADAATKDLLKGIQYLITNMAIRRERRLASLICESDSYPGGAAGAHWFAAAAAWDAAAVDPKPDIDQAVRQVQLACGVTPNTLLVPPKTYDILTSNDEVKDLIRYVRGDLYLRTGGIGDVIFNLRLIKAGATYDDAGPLEAASIAFIWENAAWDAGDDWALVCYVDPNPGLWTATFATQFVWDQNSLSPDMMGRLRVYREEAREGTWYEMRTDWEIALSNNRAGAVITGLETAAS